MDYFMQSFFKMQNFKTRILISALFGLVISKRGYDKNSLSLSGALLAVPIGFIVTVANYSFCACLLTFYLTSSMWTKCRSAKKKKLEDGFKEGGQRDWKQVWCNGGVPLLISLIYIMEVGLEERPINFAKDYTASILITSLVASIACCNADTWSSEIGTAFGSSTPILITTFQAVPAGTNGGVTVVGLFASVVGGFVIGSAFLIMDYLYVQPASFLTEYPSQLNVLLLATCAGFFGSILDSYLGAIFQYSGYCTLRKKVVSRKTTASKHISGTDYLSNDSVNFLSCLIIAVVAPIAAYHLWSS